MTHRLLDYHGVKAIWPVSRDTILRHCQRGTFPRPALVGGKNFWIEAEVIAWVNAQCAADRRTTYAATPAAVGTS